MLAVTAALERSGFIRLVAVKTAGLFETERALAVGLVALTAVLSMFLSNDMALLTVLPLTYVALRETGGLSRLAFVFVLEAAAANLGGMLLPLGSPQNMFLFSFYVIPVREFLGIMLLPFSVSMFLIVLLCLFLPNRNFARPSLKAPGAQIQLTALSLILLLWTLAILLRVLPVSAAALVPALFLIFDRKVLARLDWPLFITFIGFFIVAGNLARSGLLRDWIEAAADSNVLLLSALGSQIVSNVPAALLLAQVTDQYRELLIGVNIGGVGTLSASLANLIALSRYRAYQPGHTGSFLLQFTAVNVALLIALLAIATAAFKMELL